MPINGFTTGRDMSLQINTDGGPLSLTLRTSYDPKPMTTNKRIKGMDGVTRSLVFPDGWEMTFVVERQNSALDDYWAQYEANYYAGVNQPGATVTETISNPDGSISQYRYTGVVLDYKDAGSYRADDTVQQQLTAYAERRIKVQ